MDRYNYLIRRGQKALRVFLKAQKQLEETISTFDLEISRSHVEKQRHDTKIEELNQKKADEDKAIAFLQEARATARTRAERIAAILQ